MILSLTTWQCPQEPGAQLTARNPAQQASSPDAVDVSKAGVGVYQLRAGVLLSCHCCSGFHSNKFGGTLPSSWTSLSNLKGLEVFGNKLTGTVPSLPFGQYTTACNLENASQLLREKGDSRLFY